MSKFASFLIAMTLVYNLGIGITYANTTDIITEFSKQEDLDSLIIDINNIDNGSLDEEIRQELINKLALEYIIEEALIEKIQVDAGLTPNSFFYFLDKLIEDIKLSLASTPEDKAKIFAKIALERLAEFNSLESEDKVKYVESLIDDYKYAVGQVVEVVEQIQEKDLDSDITEVINLIGQIIEDGSNVVNAEQLPADVAEEIFEYVGQVEDVVEKAKEVVIKAQSVAGIDKEVVATLREQDLGYGEIKLISKIAAESEKTIDEVMTVYLETKAIGQTIKLIGIHPSQLSVKSKKDNIKEVQASKELIEVITEEDKGITEVTGDANEGIIEVTNTEKEVNVESLNKNKVQVNKVEDKKNEVKKQEEIRNKIEEKKEAVNNRVEERKEEAQSITEEKKEEAFNKADEKKKEALKKAEQAKENKSNNKDNKE